MQIKKLILLILTTCLIFSLVGCKNDDMKTDNNNSGEELIKVEENINDVKFKLSSGKQVMISLPENTSIKNKSENFAELELNNKYLINLSINEENTKAEYRENYILPKLNNIEKEYSILTNNIPNPESLNNNDIYIETVNYATENLTVLQIFALIEKEDYLYSIEVKNIADSDFTDFELADFLYTFDSTKK